jgi:GMP synthase (glutamine-hydrolysing)
VWDSHELVWMSHGDHVARLPEGFRPVAVSKGAPFAIIANDKRRFYCAGASANRTCSIL